MYKTGIKYFFVALMGFIIDIAFYTFLVWIGVHYLLANTMSFILGTWINVFLLRKHVFTNPRFSFFKDTTYSLACNGIGFLLGSFVIWLLVHNLSCNEVLAKVISNAFTFCLNFMVRSLFFQKK